MSKRLGLIAADSDRPLATSPEVKMLVAMLNRAVIDAFGGRGPKATDNAKWQRQALIWLDLRAKTFKTMREPLPYSFQWVAESIGLDASVVHKELRKWLLTDRYQFLQNFQRHTSANRYDRADRSYYDLS